jgi:hypothetical protein
MLLHSDPSLAEVGDLSREQLDALTCSVELRRQQLERDISDYIKQRQDELRTYEQEVRCRPQCRILQVPGGG